MRDQNLGFEFRAEKDGRVSFGDYSRKAESGSLGSSE